MEHKELEIYNYSNLDNTIENLWEQLTHIHKIYRYNNKFRKNCETALAKKATVAEEKRLNDIQNWSSKQIKQMEDFVALFQTLKCQEFSKPSRYTFDIPSYLSKPNDIVVYEEFNNLCLKHLVAGTENDFGFEQVDVLSKQGRSFLLLEKGTKFIIDNTQIAVCRNVLSKSAVIEIIQEPDYTKNHDKVEKNDRLLIETSKGFKHAIATSENGIIGSSIGKCGYYNQEKVKVLGAITQNTFEKRIIDDVL